ncbi:MAG: hypothetical protein KBA66_17800 [Leptospiraceae bacterium]|nr:hypothetical protein [Leptospiraceae bacterium]
MAYFLNKLDTSPQITPTSYSKRNPIKRILISGIILLIIIAISTFILLNYDPSNPNAEKDLTRSASSVQAATIALDKGREVR